MRYSSTKYYTKFLCHFSGGGGNYILSTSFIGYYHSESILHGGCAPMCENGYGVFYTINPDK